LDSSTEENSLFSDLQTESWETTPDWSISLSQAINLEHLSKSNSFKKDFDKSFFHYSGSLSSPPCSEGVEHFIIKNPLFIPSTYLAQLKTKTFSNDEISNARKA